MRRIPRWPIFTAIVLVLALGGLSSVGIATVRTSFPQTSGRLMVPGLKGQVEVLRDSFGVPNIYADNPEDLFLAQGYVQAQDRFFEMDFRRHLAAGRLSELFGKSQLETDAYVRTLGWRRVAEQELALLAPSTRRYLDAYAAGVNAYIEGRTASDLSLEYSLLRLQGLQYRPEPWTAADSVAWLKVMAWDLASNLDEESERAIITGKLGAARAASLFPRYPLDDFAPILRRGDVVGKTFDPSASKGSARPLPDGLSDDQLRRASGALEGVAKINRTIPHVLRSGSGAGATGSNSWAMAGSGTASGHAILSNDPHLSTSIPSIFAQVGLHCRVLSKACPFDVSGFSLASLPGVVIGKNTKIAWGLTTSYVDAQDLFLEDVRGDTVREGNSYVPLRVITEQIRVRDDQPRTIRIRSSRHGPLLSDVDQRLQQVSASKSDPSVAPYGVSLSWTALQPGHTDGCPARDQSGTELRAVSSGGGTRERSFPESSVCRYGGQHRLPAGRHGATAPQRQRDEALTRLGLELWLAWHRPVREAAVRREPAQWLPRGSEPAGDRISISVSVGIGLLLRMAQPGDHRQVARCSAHHHG